MQLSNLISPPSTAPLQAGDLVDETEAAAILNIAVTTLRNWRAPRKGPPYRKIGLRLVRYHRTDLATFNGDGDQRGSR